MSRKLNNQDLNKYCIDNNQPCYMIIINVPFDSRLAGSDLLVIMHICGNSLPVLLLMYLISHIISVFTSVTENGVISEERYAYEITAAAKHCNSNPPNVPSLFATGYVDGSCIVTANYYATLTRLRTRCPNVTGLVTRHAHLSSTAKRNMVHSIGRVRTTLEVFCRF